MLVEEEEEEEEVWFLLALPVEYAPSKIILSASLMAILDTKRKAI